MRCEDIGKCGLPRRCGGAPATKRVTVRYSTAFFSTPDEDVWNLCAQCAETLKRDAERYDYEVRIEPLGHVADKSKNRHADTYELDDSQEDGN